MNIAEIQKEIASTICLIGDKIIQNDLPVEVIDTDNELIRESKAKLLELLSEYDKEVKVNFSEIDPVMKREIGYLKNKTGNKSFFQENGNLMNFLGKAILCQIED